MDERTAANHDVATGPASESVPVVVPYAVRDVGPSSVELARAQKSLKLAGMVTIVFGLAFAIGSTAATDGPVNWFLDLAFLRSGGGPELTEYNHLSDAILGGVMVGWGVMVWMLADQFLTRMPIETKRVVLVATTAWFVVDSAASIASGGWFNALLNIGYAVMLVLPLRKI